MNELLVLALAGLSVPLGLLLLDRTVAVPHALVVLAIALTAAGELAPLPDASVGGYAIKLGDVLTLLAASVVGARLLRGRRLQPAARLLLLLIALAGFALARGVAEYGVPDAFNQARGVVPFLVLAAALAASPSTVRGEALALRGLLIAGVALAALTFLRQATGEVGVLAAGASQGRPIDAAPALLLAQGLLLLPAARDRVSPLAWSRLKVAGVLLGGAFVLTQQRTVWAATIAAALAGAFLFRQGRAQLGKVALGVLLVGSLSSIGLLFTDSGFAEDSLAGSATRVDTFTWRVQGWGELLQDHHDAGALSVLVGEPFGKPFERVVNTRLVIVAAPQLLRAAVPAPGAGRSHRLAARLLRRRPGPGPRTSGKVGRPSWAGTLRSS